MKILVIGGAGYIGSHVSKELIKNNHKVTVFDNLSSGREINIFKEEEFIHGDILDYPKLNSVMKKGFDAVIHLAAFKAAGESMILPEKYSTNNISGSLNILNCMVENKIKNIVFSSSAAVYGEPEYLPIDEKHPLNPENYYGFTKLEIERFLSWYDQIRGIKFAALRYFNAAGYDINGEVKGLEKNPANLLPVVMEVAAGMREKLQIFGDDYDTHDGTGVRDYIHVSDLAEGHLIALEYLLNKKESLTVNLGSEKGFSVLDIVKSTEKISGKKVKYDIVGRRAGDPAKLFASAQKAKDVLNWKAKYSDVDSLVKTSWDVYNKSK